MNRSSEEQLSFAIDKKGAVIVRYIGEWLSRDLRDLIIDIKSCQYFKYPMIVEEAVHSNSRYGRWGTSKILEQLSAGAKARGPAERGE